ncbi:MAG: UDP-N-acetylglucosamine diphosphorylase / glucose-phosphate thymidylyltransferase [Thermoplasmata archaeon]|nr:UDP-N-acetylglucosamine diphosphorylase / glucose-phosphate thymidylyltransferase [Thermoplasmata archaeon]
MARGRPAEIGFAKLQAQPAAAAGVDGILLAAGKGTRMAPLTPDLAKPLLEVAGRSLLHRMLDGLAAAGVTRAVVVTHHNAAQVEAACRAWKGGMKVVTVAQGTPKGTGHAVAAGAAKVDGDALVAMGDCLVDPATLAALVKSRGFALAASKVADPTRYGALKVEGRKLKALAEKSPKPPSDLVNTGLYRVPAEALEQAAALKPSPRGELEFTDVVNAWAKKGNASWIPAKGWLDVGAPWDLLAAQEAALPHDIAFRLDGATVGGPGTIEEGVQVRGRLYVETGATVKSGTYVEGDVWVGPGARVGPNAYLRGPLHVGARCHVGAAVEVKASILMEGANAPHLNYVGDSILGPGCNLGAGTKVANLKVTPGTVKAAGPGGKLDTGRTKFGVCLGPNVKTGINASLNPGTLVGAGALIGAGQVVSGWVPPASRLL